jgi:hypothetical protein
LLPPAPAAGDTRHGSVVSLASHSPLDLSASVSFGSQIIFELPNESCTHVLSGAGL